MNLDKETFEKFKKVVYDKTGIDIPEKKKILLENKLGKLLLLGKYKNLDDFYKALKSGSEESLHDLIKYITTNYSFFFREKEHFDVLAKKIKEKAQHKPVIWCAASSTGEEVYSIVISLLENKIDNFILIASDIDRNVLHKVNQGEYHKAKLESVPRYLLHRYFTREDRHSDLFKINKRLRKMIIIRRVNLIDNIRFEKKIDYIFCRNVLIYFDKITRLKVLKTLINNLADSGLLFLSMSENIIAMGLPLRQVGTSVYMKKE